MVVDLHILSKYERFLSWLDFIFVFFIVWSETNILGQKYANDVYAGGIKKKLMAVIKIRWNMVVSLKCFHINIVIYIIHG